MRTLTQDTAVKTGDTLYHPAMGFARVVEVDGVGLHLDWEEAGKRLPRRVSLDAARKGYLLCQPNGFFARSRSDLPGLRAQAEADPTALLEELLLDLVEPQERAAVGDWLARRQVVAPEAFDGWWARVALDSGRFVTRNGRVGLNLEEIAEDDPTPASTSAPWEALGPLEGEEALLTGLDLMGLLANHHASGRGVRLTRERLRVVDGRLTLVDPESGATGPDLLAAGRLLMDRILGRPLPRSLPYEGALGWVPALASPLPPSVFPLLEQLLSPEPPVRTANALGAYRAWSAAAAHEEVRENAPPAIRINWELGADTHVGWHKMRLPGNNQDYFATFVDDGEMLLVVCDGISTSDAGSGDQASRIAVQAIGRVWEHRKKGNDPALVRDLFTQMITTANTAVCEGALQAAEGKLEGRIPMGTTLVMARVSGDTVDLASLGDSKIWLITPSGPAQLNPDQNATLEWLQGPRTEEPPPQEIAHSLVGYIGHFEGDRPIALPYWSRRIRMLAGETLVLATDGIPDYAADNPREFHALLNRLNAEHNPQPMAQALIDAANRGGGGDNATVVIARMGLR